MPMEISNKIPIKSKHIEIYPFNKDEYIIKQTVYGHQINVNKDTLEVLELVDGRRNLKKIVELLDNAVGVTPKALDYLLFGQLAKYGIIEVENVNIERKGKPLYLKLSFTLLKNHSIKPLTKLLSPLFSKIIFYPVLVIFSLIVFTTLVFCFDDLKIGLESLNFRQWLLYLLFAGIVLFFHEIGHASSCSHFGAEYGDIGFGFYLLAPVMYADVSDIWKLQPSKRIIVNLSGVYMELLIGSILVAIYFVTDNNQFLAYSSIVSLSVLSNLNPFLRYDGYWILSDLAGVPNLRKESNKRLLQFFKKDQTINRFHTKFLLLTLYSLLSNILIFIVLSAIVIYDPNGLIEFPKDFYNYVLDLINENINPNFADLYGFILPLIFYYIVINFIFSYIKKIWKK